MSGGYTKGPWSWCRGLQYHITHGQFAGTQIPRSNWIADLGDGEDSFANARLISAAPDMLEALEAVLGPLAVSPDNPNVKADTLIPVDITMGELRQAWAAIAKAEGGDT